MKNFYVTLFSNSSMDFYGENKTSSFTVQLPRPMLLNGDWEVALSEIQYPYSFFNVQDGQNEITIKKILITTKLIEFIKQHDNKVAPETIEKTFPGEWVTCKIEPGFYDSIVQLISSVNGAIKSKTKHLKFFELDTKSQKVKAVPSVVTVGNALILSVKLSERLALQLGYNPYNEISDKNSASIHSVNLISGIPDKMLIYCDIVEPQIIGDKCAKVLRTTAVTPTDGATPFFAMPCCKEFTQLQYIPVQQKHFESISVDIRTTTGERMPFTYGTLSVKLHFRQH